jgi:hydrogenase maturation protease
VSAARAVLIGIGNSYRCDDGIGPALVTAVEPVCPAGVTLAVSDGEPSQLLDAWAGAPLAVLVDAVLCDTPVPGRIHRTVLDWAVPGRPAGSTRTGAAGTHGLGIPDAIRLARVLDRAPQRLVVMAVEAGCIDFGTCLSPPVAACLPALTAMVLAELTTAHPA